MASIQPRGKKWRVMWDDLQGNQKQHAVATKRAAKQVVAEIENALSLGQNWIPPKNRPENMNLTREPIVSEIAKAYLAERERTQAAGTAQKDTHDISVFLRWLGKKRRESPAASVFSRQLIRDFWNGTAIGRHDKPRGNATRKKLVEAAQRLWTWAYDEEQWEDQIPLPRKIKMPTAPRNPTFAPTWAEMDACVLATLDEFGGRGKGNRKKSENLYRLASILRFTGLRPQQVMRLRWDDFDLGGKWLTIRGELGKTTQEKSGRIVPISTHLRDEMLTWDRTLDPDRWVVPTTRKAGKCQRVARQRDMANAWKRSGAKEQIYKGQSQKAFRKGLQSELKQAGADDEAVKYLVGHDIGVRGSYIDPRVLALREAVDLIPAIKTPVSNVMQLSTPG